MDWVLLSFAVITPMSASIGMAVAQREQGLQHFAMVKTTLWNLYFGPCLLGLSKA